MFTYDMSKAGANSLYHYLYQCIKKDIVSGNVLAEEQLPSKRNLAQNLGISVVTVENAYAQLLAEGYIYSLPKKGFFVADINAVANAQVHRIRKKSRTRRLFAEPSDESEHINPKYIADFASNGADIEAFPFTTWAKITREILCERQNDLLQVSPGMGALELRRAIARMLREFRNIQVLPEQIVIGAGTDYLYSLLVQLLGFDKCYGVEDPGWSKISKLYSQYGVKVCHIPIAAESFVDSVKKSDVDVVHISPAHHFPTGMVMPVGERYRLLSWAAESPNRYIIEDDYDSEFRYRGKPIPALQGSDRGDRVIYIGTFSKAIAPAIRISYMVLPKSLLPRYREKCGFYSCTVSRIDQRIVNEFIRDGYFERYLNKMRKVYRAKHQLMLDGLSGLEKKYQITGENAGLHFVLTAKGEIGEAEILEKGRQAGIRLYGMSEYSSVKTPKKSSVLVGFGGLSDAEIKECTRLLTGILA